MKKILVIILFILSQLLCSQNVNNPFEYKKSNLNKKPKEWLMTFYNLLGKTANDKNVINFLRASNLPFPSKNILLNPKIKSYNNGIEIHWDHGYLKEIVFTTKDLNNKTSAFGYLKKYTYRDYINDKVGRNNGESYLNVRFDSENSKGFYILFKESKRLEKKKPYKVRFWTKIDFNKIKELLNKTNKKIEGDFALNILENRFDSPLVKSFLNEKNGKFSLKSENWTYTSIPKGIEIKYSKSSYAKKKRNKYPYSQDKPSQIVFSDGFSGKLPGGMFFKDVINALESKNLEVLNTNYNNLDTFEYDIKCRYSKVVDNHINIVMSINSIKGYLSVSGLRGYPSTYKAIFSKNSYMTSFKNEAKRKGRWERYSDCDSQEINKNKSKEFISSLPLQEIAELLKNDFKSVRNNSSRLIKNTIIPIPNATSSYFRRNETNNVLELVIVLDLQEKLIKKLVNKRNKNSKHLSLTSNILKFNNAPIGYVYQKENRLIFNSISPNEMLNEIAAIVKSGVINSFNDNNLKLFQQKYLSKKEVFGNKVLEYNFNNNELNYHKIISCSNSKSLFNNIEINTGIKFVKYYNSFEKFNSKDIYESCNLIFEYNNKLIAMSILKGYGITNIKFTSGTKSDILKSVEQSESIYNYEVLKQKELKKQKEIIANLKRINKNLQIKNKYNNLLKTNRIEALKYYLENSTDNDYIVLRTGEILKKDFYKSDNLYISSKSQNVTIIAVSSNPKCIFNLYRKRTYQKNIGNKFVDKDGYYQQKIGETTYTLDSNFKMFDKETIPSGFKNGSFGALKISLEKPGLKNFDYYKGNYKLSVKGCVNQPSKINYLIINTKSDIEYEKKLKKYRNSPYNKNKGLMNLIRKQKGN